jgi:hypothetical protein
MSDATIRSRCGIPLAGWVVPSADGTFRPLKAEAPGAVWCSFLNVRESVSDWRDEAGDIIDVVAWQEETPARWWLLRRKVVVVGDWEIAWSWRDQRPAVMLTGPAEFIRAERGFFVTHWGDPQAVVEAVDGVEIEFSNPWLANRLAAARASVAAANFNAEIARRIAA